MAKLPGLVRRKMLTEGLPAVLDGLAGKSLTRPAGTLEPK